MTSVMVFSPPGAPALALQVMSHSGMIPSLHPVLEELRDGNCWVTIYSTGG